MLCVRCKKRPAVVFISTTADGSEPQGYCLTCAKEMNIKQVSDIMNQMGISEDDLEAMQDQMDELIKAEAEASEEASDGDSDDESDDGYTTGGAPTFPPFFKNLFSMNKPEDDLSKKDEQKSADAKKSDKEKKKEDKKKQKKRKHIELYCDDLIKKAHDGKIDRVVGRDKEIERAIQIISRRTKNNPCLIGEPGVGKTAIVEGLALRIANGDVPFRLKNKEIFLLNLTSLVAGTQFRGQFESRIKGVIDEVQDDGNIILFIDEIHTLIGTGSAEGSMDAANILKPALSRGLIQVIGATTFDEYRKYIENDAALERRFQPITVAEPSIDETTEVLLGIKDYYETYHRVAVTDEIVRKTVRLSERYITDRFLPDKAIDLLDEACTYASLRNVRLEEYDQNKSKLDEMKKQEEESESQSDVDYEQLAKLKYDISVAEKHIEEISDEALGAEVTESDIAHVIELWTGIPASKVQDNELNKLAGLEDKLREKLIGQDEAISALAAAVKRTRVQISPRRHPASFIFVGPTGVGKTELVKVMSKELFDSPETLIRLDMSEYMEKHSVSKIIGSPPGYVGYDESGQVTEKVRRRPYSVLLFDEIEKAHPDVLNVLLQILDEGVVTDSHGRKVNFQNTVIVMTSNAGSSKKENALGFGKTEEEATREKVHVALREFLRPEFISRIDEIIVFRHLGEEDFVKIAKLMLSEYIDSLKEKGIEFTFDEDAQKVLAKKSYGGKSGARDLRNLIRKEVEDKIASAIIDNRGTPIGRIHLGANDNELKLDIL